jgi:phosphoribosylformylglycinamidine synthase
MPAYLVTVARRDDPAARQHLYLLDGELADADVAALAGELLHDPVVQQARWTRLEDYNDATDAPDIAFRPGVTDNEAESVRIGAERLGIAGLHVVRTLRREPRATPATLAAYYNPLIELAVQGSPAERRAQYAALLRVPEERTPRIDRVPLRAADDGELMRISREGILSLDLDEMRAIQAYFRAEGRDPTDGELETLAQTWSEHCSHKTFKARIRYQGPEARNEELEHLDPGRYAALHLLSAGHVDIDSLIKTFLMQATDRILSRSSSESGTPNPEPFVRSAFVDNAGIVAFGPDHEVSIKVETHNHPSALEPFGGANTGVGGVVRDVLGVSAQPIANIDVLCFGPTGLPDSALPPGVLPPRAVAAGVVAGVRDYGNKLGIPTVSGAVLYDPGYTANPLVFCGTVGLAPRGRHPRQVQSGDAVVVLGGRTGRDGIHGATFSSVELTHTTAEEVGSAVQIGDPITEKKLIDVIMQARDAGLYSAITDCGAGGLSSAVGEMGERTGAAVALDDVPLKYAGLQPWEIWLSEAQERMVLAVPPAKLAALLALCAAEDVEATVIGRFTDDGRLRVTFRGAPVVDLAMAFLHGGRPQRVLQARWEPGTASQAPGNDEAAAQPVSGSRRSVLDALKALLAHPNIATKEPIIRTYDHEVGGRTVAKPLVGAACDGPGDAAVLQPLPDSFMGLALGCGINPRYGLIDPYWMALACVDEALRNVVAVGGDPQRTAILDNFCWGDPRQPDRMAGLVRAAAGCYDAAVAYGTPFISGKDSLNNEYRDANGVRTPIPPTLLITALASVPDVRRIVTMDLKEAGNLLFMVGLTKGELGGAHVLDGQAASDDSGNQGAGRPPAGRAPASVPNVDLTTAPRILAALHGAIRDGLVRACHDLSEGGLGVAAAEMAFAGGLGLRLDLRAVPRASDVTDDGVLLFAESPTRFLAEVRPADAAAFAAALAGLPCAQVGVVAGTDLVIAGLRGEEILRASVEELKAAWQRACHE